MRTSFEGKRFVARSASACIVVSSVSTMLAAGCEAPHDSVHAILNRQSAALEKLPDEDRRRLRVIRDPAETAAREAPAVPDLLSPDDARRIALQANPDVHAAHARLEASLARIAESRSAYFPSLSLVHNSTRNFYVPRSRNPLIRPFPQQLPSLFTSDQQLNVGSVFNALTSTLFGTSTIGGGDSNSFSQHSTAMTVAWTLFDGFAREARLMASKYNYRAAANAKADVERLIVQAVDTAYLQIMLGREQLRIAFADETFSREQLAQAEKNRDSGKGTEADVLNFRVRVRAAQTNVTAAEGVLKTGRVLLGELMGLPGAVLPDTVDLPPLADETPEELTAPENEYWIERAVRNRPDLAQRKHSLESAAENVRAAKGQFSPALTLTGSYGFEKRGNMGFSDDDQASAVGVELNWQLFTGGFRTAQLRRAWANQREAAADLDRRRLAVASDVRRAIVALADAQEQVRLQRLNLTSAEENRRIVTEQYDAGKLSLVRLNEAQRDFVQTDANLTAARISLRQAWTDLHAAAATYAESPNSHSGE